MHLEKQAMNEKRPAFSPEISRLTRPRHPKFHSREISGLTVQGTGQEVKHPNSRKPEMNIDLAQAALADSCPIPAKDQFHSRP